MVSNSTRLLFVVCANVEFDSQPSQLGKEGIALFFKHHKCTRYCYASWLQHPAQRNQAQKKVSATPRFEPYFVMKSTTMRHA